MKIYKNGVQLDPSTYTEESNGVFFNFKEAPEEGLYTDYNIEYTVNPDDYAFSTGSEDSEYPGEEYFLFPNWNNAKGCGDAFWVGKYAASNENNIPVSKYGKSSWTSIASSTILPSCLTKGDGFHCIRNREWVSIALWIEKMSITMYGNIYGNNNRSNIDGQGTAMTSSMADPIDDRHKILTGTGPVTFRHNGRIDGISDMLGNVLECVDGIQVRNGVPYVLDENNENYVALSSSDIGSNSPSGVTDYINNNTNDLLNEGLPVATAGYTVQNRCKLLIWYDGTAGYRGSACNEGSYAGLWTLSFDIVSDNYNWYHGFRLARSL